MMRMTFKNAAFLNGRAASTALILLLASRAALAITWDVELAPSPAIATSIDGGAVPLRSRVSVIRLTAPVLRSDLVGAGEYWESRIECEGIGFDDFVDAHFAYRTQGVVRVPTAGTRRGGRNDIQTVAVYFHGHYGDPVFSKQIGFVPDAEHEGDALVAAPALVRGLAYASFNLAGWDDKGRLTTRMLEPAGLARAEDPSDLVDPQTGKLVAFSAAPLRKGDAVTPQTASVARDLIRASKQAVNIVAKSVGIAVTLPNRPDDLRALMVGHSFGGHLASAIVLGVNPIRPAIPSGGNRLDPTNPLSPPIVAAAIPLAASFDYHFADPGAPLIPMILINGETDPLFGMQFTVAARYGEVLAARGLGLADRVSLWSLGNEAHCPPEVLLPDYDLFGVRRDGDRWSPFVDAALGHLLAFMSADGAGHMPASYYDGQLNGDRIVFPQVGAPPTDLVPFVVDPRWDHYDANGPFGEGPPPEPLPSFIVQDFAAVAQKLTPTGHILAPRKANPIGGYRISLDGVVLDSPFEDLAQRYGDWGAYLDRSKSTIEALVRAGVYVAPRGKAALIGILDPGAFAAFDAQGVAGTGAP